MKGRIILCTGLAIMLIILGALVGCGKILAPVDGLLEEFGINPVEKQHSQTPANDFKLETQDCCAASAFPGR